MYQVDNLYDGTIVTAVRHQLIKGLADDQFNVDELDIEFLRELDEAEKHDIDHILVDIGYATSRCRQISLHSQD